MPKRRKMGISKTKRMTFSKCKEEDDKKKLVVTNTRFRHKNEMSVFWYFLQARRYGVT